MVEGSPTVRSGFVSSRMAFANLPRRPSQRILKLLKFSSPHQIATVRRSGEYSAIQREIRPFPGTRCAEPVWANPVISRDFPASPKAQRDLWRGALAVRVGFEPTLSFHLNTLSKRAPSTTRPPHHHHRSYSLGRDHRTLARDRADLSRGLVPVRKARNIQT